MACKTLQYYIPDILFNIILQRFTCHIILQRSTYHRTIKNFIESIFFLRTIIICIESIIFLLNTNIGYILLQRFTCHN